MSRRIPCCLAILVLANVVPAAPACPGTMTIGLPFLFGPTETPSIWPAQTPVDSSPVIDLKIPTGSEEAQEMPPTRKEQAHECLKVWRQLVREGRFEQAAVVAAKAASLDPTNIDSQQAVVMSQMLRNIGEARPRTEKCCESCPAVGRNDPTDGPLDPAAETALKHLLPKGFLCSPTPAKQPAANCSTNDPRFEIVKAFGAECEEMKVKTIGGSCPSGGILSPQMSGTFRVLSQVECQQPGCEKGACLGTPPTYCNAPIVRPLDAMPRPEKLDLQCVKGLQSGGVTSGGLILSTYRCEAVAAKRATIETAKWQIECDRVVRANDQEIVVEGDVRATMRQHGATVHGSRVTLNLGDGSIRTDDKK